MPTVFVVREWDRYDMSHDVIGVYSTLERALRAGASRSAEIYEIPLDRTPAYYPSVPALAKEGT